jgi:hypothetical protein
VQGDGALLGRSGQARQVEQEAEIEQEERGEKRSVAQIPGKSARATSTSVMCLYQRVEASHLVVIQSHIFAIFKILFNGTITNDKFCLSRMGRLHLSWWRLPRCARSPTPKRAYPTDANEMQCCHQEGTHEETAVDHPASPRADDRRAAQVGSGVPVSRPMECSPAEGVVCRATTRGEQP